MIQCRIPSIHHSHCPGRVRQKKGKSFPSATKKSQFRCPRCARGGGEAWAFWASKMMVTISFLLFLPSSAADLSSFCIARFGRAMAVSQSWFQVEREREREGGRSDDTYKSHTALLLIINKINNLAVFAAFLPGASSSWQVGLSPSVGSNCLATLKVGERETNLRSNPQRKSICSGLNQLKRGGRGEKEAPLNLTAIWASNKSQNTIALFGLTRILFVFMPPSPSFFIPFAMAKVWLSTKYEAKV